MLMTLLAGSIIIFTMVDLLPGDAAEVLLGQDATPESLHALRESMGLFDPLHIRYLTWISGMLRGDMGVSLSIRGCKVSDLLLKRSLNSLFLAGCACILVFPLPILIGTIAGLKRNSWLDKLISVATTITISVPEFASGILLILFFSLFLNVLPSMSNIDSSLSLVQQFHLLILPIFTLSLVVLGYLTKMVRSSVIEVSCSNYVRTAILKGLPNLKLFFKHILRNSLLPPITLIGMSMGWFFGGLIVVEFVFAYPGVGSLLFFAIMQRDVPLIETTMLFVVGGYMVFNFIVDILYMFLNPRLRYS